MEENPDSCSGSLPENTKNEAEIRVVLRKYISFCIQ